MVKGWGGHKELTKFKSHWGQNIEKKEKKNLPIKKKKESCSILIIIIIIINFQMKCESNCTCFS